MNISNDMIDKAIKECQWRNTEMGVAICNGNINLCSLEIEHGRCEALKQLFSGTSEQGLFRKENDYDRSEMNSGGVVHSDEEIKRVKKLLEQEENK